MSLPSLPTPGVPFARLVPVAVACLALFNPRGSALGAAPRQQLPFDADWRFHRGEAPGAERPGFDDAAWRALALPHDWSIEGPYDEHAATGSAGGFLPAGVGWYRKTFTLPEADRGRRVVIQFDGVYQHSTVWLNGRELGTRPYGYITFRYDLTPHLNFGGTPNVLTVRVDNSAQPNSRWYSGSGIYRHTWLLVTDPLAIGADGVCITTPEVSADAATVRVQTRLQNHRSGAVDCELVTEILPPAGGAGAALPALPRVIDRQQIAGGAEQIVDATLTVAHPQRWSPASPSLYRIRSELRAGGEVIDATETPFGIRQVVFDADRGLLLNGEPIKLRGMCVHHDGGAVGAAVPAAVLERRLRLLQEMGCNAIRCSHNPMAPEFYDLCDRLGLLVMNEAFDEWTIRKPQIQHGYSDVFAEWFDRDLIDFIRRDRNHPSIVIWSAGNEIGEQRAPGGAAVLRKLVEIFHREDPTRPVTAAMDQIFTDEGEAPAEFTGLLDVVGYNYVDRWLSRRETHYADDRVRYPHRKFIGTENSTPHDVRGEYRFGPLLGGGFADGKPVPATGPSGALYLNHALRPASLWRFVAMHDYVSGDFGWTGIDYLGEARAWPQKLSTSGALDTCGFKKDSFYFYQSQWTTKPMVHLLPHWNWPERVGQVVPVVAYTNAAAVELFLNDKSVGVKAREFPAQGSAGGWNSYAQPQIRTTTADLQLVWDVPYAPGELKAVAYDRNGAVVASTRVRTAGPAATLELTVDRTTLTADAQDVAHVTVRALDRDGTCVPLADNPVTFTLTGPGRLLGVDNGNPVSHESYQGNTRALYRGMALALVQSTAEPGAVRLVARSAGLRDGSIELVTRPAR